MERVLSSPSSGSTAGFTLVEVLIALLIGSVVLAAVMTSFQMQHKTYLAQDQVVEMQQNARVAMDMLVRDIRTAGFDPDGLGAGITVAGAQNFSFTRDDGGGALETISYALFDAFEFDDDGNPLGRNDGVADDLGRDDDVGFFRPVAENIRRLEFRYLDRNSNATGVLENIRYVQVALMAQSARAEVQSAPSARTYTTPSGAIWNSDPGFWSVYLTTVVNCRNLGL